MLAPTDLQGAEAPVITQRTSLSHRIAVFAWGIGYAVTVLTIGEFGTIGIRQSMYLNAFLLIEISKVVVRSILSPNAAGLRVVHGVFHIISFSSVDMVSNFFRDFAYYVCDMGVAYRENIDEVKAAMLDSFDELRKDGEQGAFVRDELEWFGVNTFGDSAVVVRARVKMLPGKQFGVGRAYNCILKRVFDERNIELPFPHQTIW